MFRFYLQALIFSFPVLAIWVYGCFLTPPTDYTFRAWEALLHNISFFEGRFYPNHEIELVEHGDLGHHTPDAVAKEVVWRTDRFGYRNNEYRSQPDVVFVGDSTIAGSSISQEEMIAARVESITGFFCYTVAPADINKILDLRRKNILRFPKRLLVLGVVERNIKKLPSLHPAALYQESRLKSSARKAILAFDTLPVYYDKLQRGLFKQYLRAEFKRWSGLGAAVQPQPVSARIDGETFLFLQGEHSAVGYDAATLNALVSRIESYHAFCQENGFAFLFVPIPNKETIYWKELELSERPGFAIDLIKALKARGVPCIDTVGAFDSMRNQGEHPYHRDDTHWNAAGIQRIAEAVASYLLDDAAQKP